LEWIFDHFWPLFRSLFWRLWADYLSLVFEVNFGPFFGQFSIADLLVLRDFFDFEGCSGPVFGPLLDRTFARVFTRFGTQLVLRVVFGPRSILYPSAL
jgi:hypothetical protein